MTPSPPLHVAHLGFHVDPLGRDPARLLHEWPTLVDVAEAAQGAGVRVCVVQACQRSEHLTRNDVHYHFFAADPAAGPVARTAGFSQLIRDLRPDVFHVHGLGFPADVVALSELSPDTPILLQDHASQPPRLWWKRRRWRRAMAAASAIVFCAHEQSEPFARAGLVNGHSGLHEIPESSSHFTPGDQSVARARTGLRGDPCLLWIGRLDSNKDPLTVLAGVSEASRHLPDLQLWCYFGEAPLKQRVEHRILSDPRLRARVHLMGQVAHPQVEWLMRAADLFVLGSHREGSGYALIEALACGLPPVVSDIPSFRSLSGRGGVGRLWPCGDAAMLSAALISIASEPRALLRGRVRAHFDHELSFAVVGRKLAALYRQLRERH